MRQALDIDNWERKSTYDFFKNFEDPFFNIIANVEVTQLYDFCKQQEISFFLGSIYFSIKAINNIPNFRYRIVDGMVVEYDRVHPGSTVLMEDNSFLFCYFDYVDELKKFVMESERRIVKLKSDRTFDAGEDQLQMIHYSIIPWVSFTHFKHPRMGNPDDSIPKIVFGKFFEQDGKKLMPVSIACHHALADGYHVGMLFQEMEKAFSFKLK